MSSLQRGRGGQREAGKADSGQPGGSGHSPRFERHVVIVLACLLALDSADRATVGSVAKDLQQSLHLSHTQLGLVVSLSSIVGALATLPVGALADRARRVRMLAVAAALWGAGSAVTAAATSFAFLLCCRLALGAVLAVAGPVTASLVGDWFPAAQRGRIYGSILTGELVGTGIGFVATGNIASFASWRWSFLVLAVPAAVLVPFLWRLPEPARCGQDRSPGGAVEDGAEQEAVRDAGVQPDRRLAEAQRRVGTSLWRAARVVLAIKTNVVLIIGSTLGYFVLAGAQTFGVEVAQGRYGLSHAVATSLLPVLGLGALVGVQTGGRLSDRLTRRGHISARIVVAGTCYVVAAIAFAPAMLVRSVLLAAGPLVIAAAFLGAANPPNDAARLDIVFPLLWGRAEAVRSLLRSGGQALAPLFLGALADSVFGGGALGLSRAFLCMLVPLLAGGAVLIWGQRTYPRDTATATAARESDDAEPSGAQA